MAKRVRFAVGEVERAARFELTMPDLQSGALAAWRRAHDFGAEGEARTLEASLEDSHVASYITPACVKVELLTGLEPATATFEASDSSS